MSVLLNRLRPCWLPVTLLLMVIIATLSLWPQAELPEVPGSDKTHHLIAYAVLVLPVAFFRPRGWYWLLPVFVVFSGLIELVQPYVNRYGEWLDLAANVSGLCVGLLLAWGLRHLLGRAR